MIRVRVSYTNGMVITAYGDTKDECLLKIQDVIRTQCPGAIVSEPIEIDEVDDEKKEE